MHWSSIVRLYDAMLRRSPTALIALSRAVAEASGYAAGLRALEQIHDTDDLQGNLQDYPTFTALAANCCIDSVAETTRSTR